MIGVGRTLRARPLALAGVVALALTAGTDSGRAQALGAEQVKAAFLFNFAKFVQWPSPGDGPIVIGVAGHDAFAEIVAQTVRGRTVNGRGFHMRRLSPGDDPAGCHVVFIGVMRAHDAADWLQRVSGPVLTVGETVQFLRDGGMVRFYVEDNNVRFQINQRTAEAAGLKISSQLLTLAAR